MWAVPRQRRCPSPMSVALTPGPREEAAIRSGAGGPAEKDGRDALAEPSPLGPAAVAVPSTSEPPPTSHLPFYFLGVGPAY